MAKWRIVFVGFGAKREVHEVAGTHMYEALQNAQSASEIDVLSVVEAFVERIR